MDSPESDADWLHELSAKRATGVPNRELWVPCKLLTKSFQEVFAIHGALLEQTVESS
jgi:hypothetical protein